LTILLLSLFAFSAVASAAGFSADIVSCGGKEIMTGKIYLAGDKIRTEYSQMITIMRMDKKVIWMIMPEEKMYMEQPFDLSNIRNRVPSAEPAADEVERVLIGQEAVNGYAADKYRVTVKTPKGQSSHYMWLSGDPGMVMAVKTAAIDGSWWQEFRNIQLGTPDDALFELPAGYSKMSFSGMMGR
jgi:hypothetical protein